MGFWDAGKPLTSASDNLHMTTIAKIARVVSHPRMPGIGDEIDQGLITLRLLNEAGYDVVPNERAPILNEPPNHGGFLPNMARYIEIIAQAPSHIQTDGEA